MSDNPFVNFEIRIPKLYSDKVKKFCSTGGDGNNPELSPFKRQVDLWFFAFVYAVKKGIKPEIVSTKDTVNVINGVILSEDSAYRVSYIQAVYLSYFKDVSKLVEHRAVFDFASSLANAGLPYVLQILDDSDGRPLFNIFDEIEGLV